MKEKKFTVKCGIYPVNIVCLFGGKIGKKALGKTRIKGNNGLVTDIQQATSFLYMYTIPKTPKELSTLFHEIFHIAVKIMNYVGIKLSNDSEEAFAYLIDHITFKILNKLQS